MPSPRASTFFVRACSHLASIAAVIGCLPVTGQPEGVAGGQSCDLASLSPRSPRVDLHRDFFSTLQSAAACLARNDSQCAEQLLSKIDTASLSDDEKVLLVGERAEVASRRGNAAAALELFNEAAKQPMASRDAKGIMAQKYAAAVLAAGDPAGALKALAAAFDCASWTADALATRAAAYQRIFAYAFALANFDAAIRLYQMAGRTVPAGVNAMRQQVADALSRQGEQKDSQSVVENTDPASADGQEDRPTDSSREAAAMIRVAPNYPEQALARGITGSVRLEFSISENGVVENARVVKSSDRILEQAALEALQKWRYVPRLRDGLPVRRDGVQTTIQFALDGRVLR